MVKYINSPLKITGSLLLLVGFGVVMITVGQFLFLGVSIMSLGILIHITAAILLRSVMRYEIKRIFEFALVLFIVLFFSFIVMDYFGIINIT